MPLSWAEERLSEQQRQAVGTDRSELLCFNVHTELCGTFDSIVHLGIAIWDLNSLPSCSREAACKFD